MKNLTILTPLVLLTTTTLAQSSTCIVQPSCSQLGYTQVESDCGSSKVIRCPFDVSQVACVSGGNVSGSGDDGNGDCKVGDFYYADDTCSDEFDNLKEVIGMVVDKNYKLAIGLHSSSTTVSSLTVSGNTGSVLSEEEVLRDGEGEKNTEHLVAAGYSAAIYCNNLTLGGKKWFLPSVGQLHKLYGLKDQYNDAISNITGLYSNLSINSPYNPSSYTDYRSVSSSANVSGVYTYKIKYDADFQVSSTFSSSVKYTAYCFFKY